MNWRALTLALHLAAPSTITGTIAGPATVQDGDTIYVNHQAVRLWGVDAEELSEPNGPAAKFALRAIIGGAEVTCTLRGNSYNRNVGLCTVGGADIGRAIIAAGRALDCKRYSGGAYRADEPTGVRGRLHQKPYC